MLVNAKNDDELIAIWLSRQGSEHTRAAYKLDVERALGYFDKRLGEILYEDITNWQEVLEGRYSASTVRRRIASLRSLLKFGWESGYLDNNVARLTKVPPQSNKLTERILPRADVLDMIDAVEGRDRLIVQTLYVLGLRVSELTRLTWRNLRAHGDSGVARVKGKGAKDRTLRVPKKLWDALMELRLDEHGPDDAIFQSHTQDKGLHRKQVGRIVKRAARDAGIDLDENPVSPHWMRHAHASHAIDAGVPLHVIRDNLGHSSLQITSRYLHARPEQSSGAALVA